MNLILCHRTEKLEKTHLIQEDKTMNSYSKIRLGIVSGLLILLVMGLTRMSVAQERRGDHRGFPGQRFVWTQLTEEQRTELRALIGELREQGVEREEIRQAVREKLKGWGIEVPEGGEGRHGFRRFGRGQFGFRGQLTEEQRKILRDKIEELRDQDASRQEIREAIVKLMEEWGIDRPGIIAKLTDEQREAVRHKVKEMRDQGATRKEIREAIDEMLKGWGIELPDRMDGRKGRMGRKRGRGETHLDAQVFPNPFNPETTIYYSLQSPEHVTVRVYNIQGQLIRTLTDEHRPAGHYTVRWDGRLDNGEYAAAGIYVYRIDAGQRNLTGRMALMK